MLLPLDDQGQPPLEDEVDLLLMVVGMNPPTLAGLQDNLVHPETLDAKLASERLEALGDLTVDLGEGDLCHLAEGSQGIAKRLLSR